MLTSTVTVLCLASFGASSGWARAEFVPNVTYYAPYPIWYPRYFGPVPYTDYLVVQYATPPAETAAIIKQRVHTINAANPALLPPSKEPLTSPKPDNLPPPQK